LETKIYQFDQTNKCMQASRSILTASRGAQYSIIHNMKFSVKKGKLGAYLKAVDQTVNLAHRPTYVQDGFTFIITFQWSGIWQIYRLD